MLGKSVTNKKGILKVRVKVIKRLSISIALSGRDSTSEKNVYEAEEDVEGSGLIKMTQQSSRKTRTPYARNKS